MSGRSVGIPHKFIIELLELLLEYWLRPKGGTTLTYKRRRQR